MPAKNSVKTYLKNGYYHLYNCGVEKRKIFLDDQDYKTFIHFLKYYLVQTHKFHPLKGTITNEKCLLGQIELLSYCLMPNHYHLLIKQYSLNGISKLIKYVCTNYTNYFNHKYQRIGSLYQGVYKAILIKNEPYLLQLTKYIHLNPVYANLVKTPKQYNYSSYQNYLNLKSSEYVKPNEILEYFRSGKDLFARDILSYESFVETHKETPSEILGDLILE